MTRINQKLSEQFKTEVTNGHSNDGRLSFTVASELVAYKAAYYYRNSAQAEVKFAPNVGLWLVTVWS